MGARTCTPVPLSPECARPLCARRVCSPHSRPLRFWESRQEARPLSSNGSGATAVAPCVSVCLSGCACARVPHVFSSDRGAPVPHSAPDLSCIASHLMIPFLGSCDRQSAPGGGGGAEGPSANAMPCPGRVCSTPLPSHSHPCKVRRRAWRSASPRLPARPGPNSSCRGRQPSWRPPLGLEEQSGPRGGHREKGLLGGYRAEFTPLGRKGKG